jgi:hypothetical protein
MHIISQMKRNARTFFRTAAQIAKETVDLNAFDWCLVAPLACLTSLELVIGVGYYLHTGSRLILATGVTASLIGAVLTADTIYDAINTKRIIAKYNSMTARYNTGVRSTLG